MKIFIKNRKGDKISVLVEEKENIKTIAFVMHGLLGFKEQDHIRTFIKSFLDNNISVVSFDTTNSFGESDGNYENATVTNYYEDLEDVIDWASKQNFYKEKFILAGHSLGGICNILYTQKNPEKVMAIAPISTIVSGKLSISTISKEDFSYMEKIGYEISESKSKPLVIKKLKFSHFDDRLKYDVLPEVYKIKMPTLLIVGENDTSTPVVHQKILFEKLSGERNFMLLSELVIPLELKKNLMKYM